MTDNIVVERKLPAWVPDAVSDYLAHIEDGQSIRTLAKLRQTHPSTIMRQVRKYEMWRDDPLIDDALRDLAASLPKPHTVLEKGQTVMTRDPQSNSLLTQDLIEQEAKRVLRRLCEPQAVLAAAATMQTAVVVRETPDGESIKTAIIERPLVQALALKEWISCAHPDARIQRYSVTAAGREALRLFTAQDENKAQALAQGTSTQPQNHTASSQTNAKKSRYYVTESPLIGLSRRKDKDGQPFLKHDLMSVGERLREDYEIALMGASFVATWDGVMATPEHYSPSDIAATQSSDTAVQACLRIRAAMADLGPGLGDIALKCCCLLEGLEVTEKEFGWSARSGKIVLRIALQRLARHYEETTGKFAPTIG